MKHLSVLPTLCPFCSHFPPTSRFPSFLPPSSHFSFFLPPSSHFSFFLPPSSHFSFFLPPSSHFSFFLPLAYFITPYGLCVYVRACVRSCMCACVCVRDGGVMSAANTCVIFPSDTQPTSPHSSVEVGSICRVLLLGTAEHRL